MPSPRTSANVTTAAPSPAARPEKPEWLRIRDACFLKGIGRSKLYELIQDGKVKSVTLRPRGSIKPIRLVSYDSLTKWFNAATVKCEYSVGKAA